jgi:hypothetical protein
MADHTQLLAQVSARAHLDHAPLPEPVTEAEIGDAEERLGFRLHPLLAAVYRRIADGGFGPDYQLLSLIKSATSETIVSTYLVVKPVNSSGVSRVVSGVGRGQLWRISNRMAGRVRCSGLRSHTGGWRGLLGWESCLG